MSPLAKTLKTLWIAFGFLLLIPMVGFAEEEKPSFQSPAEAIENLGSEASDTREAATRYLIDHIKNENDSELLETLKKVATNDDPEIAHRALQVIKAAPLFGLRGFLAKYAGLDFDPNGHELKLENLETQVGEIRTVFIHGNAKDAIAPEDLGKLSLLKHLPNLRYLSLYRSGARDVAFLSECKNLDYLSLNQTHVTDITALAGLTKLRRLNLGWFKGTDLSPISKLTELEELYLSGLPGVDLTILSNFEKLTSLRLRKSDIKDLSLLPQVAKKLKTLDLRGNPIESLEPLAKLHHLESLYLKGTQADLSPLEKLENLRTLVFISSEQQLAPIANFKSLEILIISSTELNDLSFLLKTKPLHQLDLKNCTLSAVAKGQLEAVKKIQPNLKVL